MRVVTIIAGLGVGVLLGVGLLSLNPIVWFHPPPVGLSGAVRTLGWESGGRFAGFPLTPGGLLGLSVPSDAGRVATERGVRLARAEAVLLTGDAELPAALGVRLSALAEENSLLRARFGIVTQWNIVWPGMGSVLLSGSENLWPPLRDGLWSALRGRGLRPTAVRYALSPLPGREAAGFALGTGAFAEAAGAFREEFSPVDGSAGDFTGRRQLQFTLE
jgi:hypothetical protein